MTPEQEYEEDEEGPRSKTEQGRIDGMTREKAIEQFKDESARHAELAERWRTAQQTRDVRLDDLVKAFLPGEEIDGEVGQAERQKVAKSAAKAVKAEKRALEQKQEAAQALKVAWQVVQTFETREPVKPLIPDPEPAPEPEAEAGANGDEPAKPKRGKKKRAMRI